MILLLALKKKSGQQNIKADTQPTQKWLQMTEGWIVGLYNPVGRSNITSLLCKINDCHVTQISSTEWLKMRNQRIG